MKDYKKLFVYLFVFQLLSCGGINVSDIPLENVAEHKKIINENIEDKEALEKAYVELSVENDQVWDSPFTYYYLSLIYSNEYESLFDLDPLESGLALFPNDPFLNNMKVNYTKGGRTDEIRRTGEIMKYNTLEYKLEGYKNILENHPRFYMALVDINYNYTSYWNTIEDDKDIILEKERVQDLFRLVDLYQSGDNNTSEHYNFNEIFSDTIAYNFPPFETIKLNFELITKDIEDAEEREREKIREERERRISARNSLINCINDSKWVGRLPNFPSVYSEYKFNSNTTFRYETSMFGGGMVGGNWNIINFDKRQIRLINRYNSWGIDVDDSIITVNSSCNVFSIGNSVYRKEY